MNAAGSEPALCRFDAVPAAGVERDGGLRRMAADEVHDLLEKVPLWFSSSGGRGGRLVEGSVSEHGEEDVDA
ncbi:hypothetical protein, partial [Streptomyces sp. NPDC001480]|uniref:hypothetical protein n=1 Tax=Streptomyces sp. NPDC001480 TaxID=3364577 RepID=UPI0036AAA6C4